MKRVAAGGGGQAHYYHKAGMQKAPITEPAELTHCRADCFQKGINPQGFFLVTLYQSDVEGEFVF